MKCGTFLYFTFICDHYLLVLLINQNTHWLKAEKQSRLLQTSMSYISTYTIILIMYCGYVNYSLNFFLKLQLQNLIYKVLIVFSFLVLIPKTTSKHHINNDIGISQPYWFCHIYLLSKFSCVPVIFLTWHFTKQMLQMFCLASCATSLVVYNKL